jgi:hypothetical protein
MISPAEPIRGKIARVLNTREVAINKGTDNGVEIGMIFKILSTKGSEIKDPDTGESLGSVESVKTTVKVIAVQERIAVASTYRSKRVNVGGRGVPFTTLFEPPRWETRYETLKIDDAAIAELDEEDSFVQAGDPVVQDLEIVPIDTAAED